ILSDQWADTEGRNQLGAVLLVDQVLYSSREVQKGDARPGGYVATGGFGGIFGTVGYATTITNVPHNRRHTYTSAVNVTNLPNEVMGLTATSDGVSQVRVAVKDVVGNLLPSAIPYVSIVKASRWRDRDVFASAQEEVEIMARIEAN